MFIIDKIFNLKIDTKNKNISNVTGFKQFDNNSILNITLLQNNLALDLSNYAIRINFLREDNKVLLYMANIVNSKEGKLSIKVSPEVLEKTGNVQADISVFDSNLLKITSATFTLKVDKAIYNSDTYFSDKDLDLMQQEYVREKERQQSEGTRKFNETTRIQAETKRNSSENSRISNEEARKKAENTRVEEWNNVKKDATNIKNTLDTTISTANNTNSNLKNTINAGDKLKEDLNTKNYVKNADYQQFKKESTTQYEDTTKKLNDFGGRNYLLNSDFHNKFDNWSKNGKNAKDLITINEKGNVVCKNGEGEYFGIYQYIKESILNYNATYTLSFSIKVNKDSDLLFGWNDLGIKFKVKPINEFQHYSLNIGHPKPNYSALVLYIQTHNSTLEIENVKLEKGTIATDWNIAPEEIISNSIRLDAIEKILINKGFMEAKRNMGGN